jgi:16S rRNA (cytidine1402-2'-O)-methyltransferase
MTGVLYVVATPIGNLDDMSARARTTLQQVALIAAEDTRHSARLLQFFDIQTPCTALHDHNEQSQIESLIARIMAGDSIALISDAGTPLISDPGYRLVAAAQAAGIRVSPVPGACAAIAALSAAGLPSDRFVFEGFLPAKSVARRSRLEALATETRTLIFYEAPHRIEDCLRDMAELFGPDRRITLGRELTKTFETIRQLPAAELSRWVNSDANQQRGEIVLVAEGAPESARTAGEAETERLLQKLLDYLPVKKAAQLAAELTGRRKNELYDLALALQAGSPSE